MFRNLDSLPSEKGNLRSWSLVDKDEKDKMNKKRSPNVGHLSIKMKKTK